MKWLWLLPILSLGAYACTSDDDGSTESGDGSSPCRDCLFNQCCQDGECVEGSSSQSCGAHGNACRQCASGSCINGSCAGESCNSLSCPNGCCSAGGCQTPSSEQACGVNGQPCDVCGSDELCQNGVCTQAVARSYRVVLVGASLPPEADCGWLDDCDLYAIVTFSRGGSEIRTAPVEDTSSPTWNKELIAGTPGELTTGAIKVEILDEDSVVDSSLGFCEYLPSREELIAGFATKSCSSGEITFQLSFRFTGDGGAM